ncbi:MAG TPA: sulfatase-like hydrolase/transferase [Phycisphaerae bacterium]|nr:sulfatase-like hydrolase/transferase [Phycisphaerae bacterium]
MTGKRQFTGGEAARPNIVQIVADDMGYGDFGCFSEGRTRTPAIDQLVAEGVCLTQQYTASPVCNPSRATLLTGRYPHRTGSIDTLEWRGLERLALRETTLADVLKAAGYATGLVGKWHLGAFDNRYHPNARGFDEAVCFRGGMHDYYKWRLEFNDAVKRADGRYLTDVWTEEACAFIERHAGRPFFLQVTYNAPHSPLQAPEEEVRPFAETGRFNRGVSIVYGMIHRMDDGIARILETLKARGLEDNTIVMFTSDNGPQFGGQGETCTTRFNCGWRGCKGNVYEGGIRVPAVIRWPGVLARGREIHEMVHFADYFPTLLAAAGVEAPKRLKLDGVNMLPVLLGQNGKVCTRRFWQWNRYTPLVTCNAAMRDGDWKLVRPVIAEAMAVPDIKWLRVSMYEPEHFIANGIIREGDPPRQVPLPPPAQLFNLADDPLEQHDLAAEHPQRVSKMLRELETWFEEVEAERATIRD